jgi:DNA-directed RNA polymerase specialized sigma24 family protein
MVMTKKETKQQEALTSAHNYYGKGLNSYAFFKLRDHAVGEDMVQDTFLKTWSYIVRGGKIQTMRAFLYHILNNLIVDQYRKKKNKNASLDAMLENGYEPSGTDSENPFNTLGGKMAFPLIQRLPEKIQKSDAHEIRPASESRGDISPLGPDQERYRRAIASWARKTQTLIQFWLIFQPRLTMTDVIL